MQSYKYLVKTAPYFTSNETIRAQYYCDSGVILSHNMGDFDENEDHDRNIDTRTTNTTRHGFPLLPGESCSLFGFLSGDPSSILLILV